MGAITGGYCKSSVHPLLYSPLFLRCIHASISFCIFEFDSIKKLKVRRSFLFKYSKFVSKNNRVI